MSLRLKFDKNVSNAPPAPTTGRILPKLSNNVCHHDFVLSLEFWRSFSWLIKRSFNIAPTCSRLDPRFPTSLYNLLKVILSLLVIFPSVIMDAAAPSAAFAYESALSLSD